MSHSEPPILLPYQLNLASTLPESDGRALTEISDASQARGWMQRKLQEYKNHAFTLLAIHNSVSPINNLPTELFQKILINTPSESPWCHALWMLSLGSVCRQWRSVLLTTPEYWARGLHTVMDPSFYDCYDEEDIIHGRDLFLARSAPCPLEITMDYSSDDFGPGWDAFEDHYDRVTVFAVMPNDEIDLDCIFDAMTREQGMKRLERLQVDGRWVKLKPRSKKCFLDWEAEALPCLGHMEISGHLFCRATTVPSLHTVILTRPPLDIGSLPHLLDALDNCPALATLRLELSHKDDTFQNKTLKRVLDLHKLQNLAITGGMSDVRCLLTALTFPSTTLVELEVLDTGNEQDKGLVLPNVLPPSLSTDAHQLIDGVDRLCFYSKPQVRSEAERAVVCMRASIQGQERLHIGPAFWLHSADHFLKFLKLFRECRVTELVLDLRHAPSDMDGEFWSKFFVALPDVLRLQLLSPTAESRAMKRDMAEHYLASCGIPHAVPETALVDFICRIAPPRIGVSIAWVLPYADESNPSRFDELGDVRQFVLGYANGEGIASLRDVELYLTAPNPDPSVQQAFDVTEICGADGMPSQMLDSLVIPGVELGAAVELVLFTNALPGFTVADNDHESDVDSDVNIRDEPMVVDEDN